MAIIDKIQISGTSYDVKDASAVTVVDILQADYDELPESAKTSNIIYNITDAPEINMNDYVSKAENVVPESWAYLISENNNIWIEPSWQVKFVRLQRNQGYTPQNTVYGSYYIWENGSEDSGAFYLDYANKIATDYDTTKISIEYDEDIDDFYIRTVSSTAYMRYIYASDEIYPLVPIKHFASGQTASVVRDEIEPVFTDVYTKMSKKINNLGAHQGVKNYITIYGYIDNGQTSVNIDLGKTIVNKNNKLETDIKVPLGVSGWVETEAQGCCFEDKVNPVFRVKYVNRPSGFRILICGDWGSGYNYLTWNDDNQDYVFDRGVFDGTYEGYSAATFTHDSVNKVITFTYPLTVQPEGYSEPKNVFLCEICNNDCNFGPYLTFEYYGELVQALIPYVQGKQDILSAGTGIDITNNVISVTGGGGGGSSYTAGYGIDIDTANTISVTGQVASSAITTAVTTASTDSEIPTAKAVNDAIAAGGGGGGGTTYSAGTNISISNDTINCTLPISARTTSLIYGGGTNTITVNSAVPLNYNNIFGTGNTLSATTNVNTRENSCNFIYGLDNSLKAGGMKLNHKFNLLFGSGNTIECSNAYGGETVLGNVLIGFYNQITAQTQYSFVQGSYNKSSSNHQFIGGRYLVAKNSNEATFGTFNVSNTGSTDADKTIFSIGNGTANDARHNAFEIRKNGDIYISSGGTDIKLQDNLGGGGGGGTVDQTVISGSTNAVAGGAVYDQLGGMKIVKLTESEYAALVTKDSDTLYVVIPDPSN